MAILGWLLLAGSAGVFATRYLTVTSQPLVVAATFAYLAIPVSALSALLLAVAGSPLAAVALALALGALAIEVAPWLRRSPRGVPVLTVMTANVWFGRGNPRAVLELAAAERADVVALQETTEEFVEGLVDAGIEEAYPYSIVAAGPLWQGAGLWSRYPLRDARVTERGTLFRVEATARLGESDADDDPLVASIHVHAPWPGEPGPWLEQLEEIGEQLGNGERPLVLAGDYNATLDHRPFRQVLRAATDATVSARAWWTRTWPAHLAMPAVIAIDHVLLRGYGASRVRTHRVEGADHRALVARLVRRADGDPGAR